MIKKTKTAGNTLFLLLLLFIPPTHAAWFKTSRAIMGTAIHVELWHENEQLAEKDIQLVLNEMHRIDALMSPYKRESEVSLINTLATKQPVTISPELFNFIQHSFQNVEAITVTYPDDFLPS